eukprot:1137503-Pelagomonas_calceolata.AAC.6
MTPTPKAFNAVDTVSARTSHGRALGLLFFHFCQRAQQSDVLILMETVGLFACLLRISLFCCPPEGNKAGANSTDCFILNTSLLSVKAS